MSSISSQSLQPTVNLVYDEFQRRLFKEKSEDSFDGGEVALLREAHNQIPDDEWQREQKKQNFATDPGNNSPNPFLNRLVRNHQLQSGEPKCRYQRDNKAPTQTYLEEENPANRRKNRDQRPSYDTPAEGQTLILKRPNGDLNNQSRYDTQAQPNASPTGAKGE